MLITTVTKTKAEWENKNHNEIYFIRLIKTTLRMWNFNTPKNETSEQDIKYLGNDILNRGKKKWKALRKKLTCHVCH